MSEQNKPIQVFRNGLLESTHMVHVAVVGRNGQLLHSYGDPFRMTFPRSALKPFQAIPLIESGAADTYGFGAADIAVCCASHSGEERHRTCVKHILERLQLDDSYLTCGTHVPRDRKGYEQWIREGKEVTPVFHNCSGKHTGMLAACLQLHEDISTYNEPDHPLQKQIIDDLFNVCDLDSGHFSTGTDGCGLPTHRFPLDKLALGFARLARPDLMSDQTHSDALERIKNSMMKHPEMVGGEGRFDTDVMHALPGKIVTKMGAEGIQGIGLPEVGIGIAVKVEDGNNRGSSVAAMRVLQQLGIGNETFYKDMSHFTEEPIANAKGLTVGKITANFTLT